MTRSRSRPLSDFSGLWYGTVLAAAVTSLWLFPQATPWRAHAMSTFDTLPAAPSTVGTVTVTLGGVIAAGGLVLNVIDRASRPAVALSAELHLDTLVVPRTGLDTARAFSEPWIRGAIAIRNTGTAAATGVTVISPVSVARWRYALERVGARESVTFTDGRLAIGSLPPGAWAAVSLWWSLGEDAPPLGSFVVLHDDGTERPELRSRNGPRRTSLIVGALIAGLGGLMFAASTTIGRIRRRRGRAV